MVKLNILGVKILLLGILKCVNSMKLLNNNSYSDYDTFKNDTNVLNLTSLINNKTIDYGDNVDEDIDVDWYIILFLSLLYGAISIISVFGNSLIIWTVMRNKRMRNVTNYFISNLAIADIIIGVLVAPFQFQTALLQRWIFPRILCKIAPFAATLSVNVSILTLVAISIDRYHVILYPFKQKLRMKQCYFIIIFIWLISLLLSIIKLLNFNSQQDLNKNVLICGPTDILIHKYETIILIIIQYIIPFILILFTYSRIGFHIYYDDSPNSVTNNQSQNKKKVIKMILIVVILFMICWAPLQLFNFLNVVYPDSA